MRIVKLLIFVAIVIALFFGVYWLVVRPKGVDSNFSASDGLRQMCLTRINAYGDSVGQNGWDEQYLIAAQTMVRRHIGDLPEAEINHLDNSIQSIFIAKIDSLIRACYGQAMSSGEIRPGSRLDKAYSGLDRLAVEYPSVKSSQRWSALSDLRATHKEIYDFGNRSYSPSERLNLKLVWNGESPSIRYSSMLNFGSYSNSIKAKRADLYRRCNEVEELRNSPWTAKALDSKSLDDKLASARTAYYNKERRLAQSFLNNLMQELHKGFSRTNDNKAAYASRIIEQLDALNRHLVENGIKIDTFDNVKNQIRRIYITQVKNTLCPN